MFTLLKRAEIYAGSNISFPFADSKSNGYNRRVIGENIEKFVDATVKKNLLLLHASALIY
jgi:hypothetical protein